MESVIKLINKGDNGKLQISNICYESQPCQHYCYYITQDNKKIELCFVSGPQILHLLKTGIGAESICNSNTNNSEHKYKSLDEIILHFLYK